MKGLEDFNSTDDFVIPRRSLVQNTSRVDDIDEALPGTFIDETTRTVVGKTMHAALLKVKKNRALFYGMDSGKKGLQCWSPDANIPSPTSPEKQAETCAACPHSKKDLQYDMLCYDIDESETLGAPVVFWLRAKGTSLFPAKTLISMLLQRRKRAFDFTFKITGAKASGKKGSYFVLGFSDVTMVSDDILPQLESAYEVYAQDVEQPLPAMADEPEAQTETNGETPF
jgi:hypothetical protein